MTDDLQEHRLRPVDPDEAIQAAVLASLLTEHPAQLTAGDLYRERRDPEDLRERDAVDRAVQVLVSAGLVHRSGPFLVPSRAALKSEELSSM